MKNKTRAHLIKRLKQFGAEANLRDPVETELDRVTTVSVPLPFLNELLDAMVGTSKPRGRPRGMARLSHHAFVAAMMIRDLGAGKGVVEMLAERARLDKAQTRNLRIMVNEHLRRDQGSWEDGRSYHNGVKQRRDELRKAAQAHASHRVSR